MGCEAQPACKFLFEPTFWWTILTVKVGQNDLIFGMLLGFISRFVHAKLQVSVCSGYDVLQMSNHTHPHRRYFDQFVKSAACSWADETTKMTRKYSVCMEICLLENRNRVTTDVEHRVLWKVYIKGPGHKCFKTVWTFYTTRKVSTSPTNWCYPLCALPIRFWAISSANFSAKLIRLYKCDWSLCSIKMHPFIFLMKSYPFSTGLNLVRRLFIILNRPYSIFADRKKKQNGPRFMERGVSCDTFYSRYILNYLTVLCK